ncbi:MAG: TolC family protein [Treponema sp.]|nr:TolC family protein [Treponema sp.]
MPGANISGGISFSMSVPNNARKANVENAQASYKQAQVQLLNAKNTLSAQLKNNVSQLNSWRNQVVNANNVLELREQLYDNEQRRFTSGLITVEEMSNQDSKYLDAQIQYYQIMIAYFKSVLEYKYYTGSLVEVTGNSENVLNSDRLYVIE